MAQELAPRQLRAVDLFAQGLTDREVAERIGVNPSTAWRWRKENPVFISELNRRHDEAFSAVALKLESLALPALEVVARMLQSTDHPAAMRAALAVLRMLGVDARRGSAFDLGRHFPTDPQVIAEEQERAVESEERERRLRKEEEDLRDRRREVDRDLNDLLYPQVRTDRRPSS